MVKGLIINKFRGDKSILGSRCGNAGRRSGIPVVGVAPYLQIEVEDEDSLTERFDSSRTGGQIDIAVIRLPRISNLQILIHLKAWMACIFSLYGKCIHELKNPDLIILPGTKSTMSDLAWMRQNGLEAAILKAAAGTLIFRCLRRLSDVGETLSDPDGVEGAEP